MDYTSANDQDLDMDRMRNILEIRGLEIALDFQKINVLFKSLEDIVMPTSMERGIRNRKYYRHTHAFRRKLVCGVAKRIKPSYESGKPCFTRRFGVWVRKLDEETTNTLIDFAIPQKLKQDVRRTTNFVKINRLLEQLHEIKPMDPTATRDEPNEEPAQTDCPQDDVKHLEMMSKNSKQ